MIRRYLPAFMTGLLLLCAWLALTVPHNFSPGAEASSLEPASVAKAQRTPERAAPSSPEDADPPVLPPGFVQVPVASGLSYPTSFAFAPDGRIFITEKAGTIRVLKNGSLLPAPMLDLSAQVNDFWDRGMMTVAVDPNFETNKYIYIYYTYEPDPAANKSSAAYEGPKTNRLVRYTVQGDVVLTTTQKVLVGTVAGTLNAQSCNNFPAGSDCIPSDSPAHIGGAIKFSQDGSLFFSTGDASNFNNVTDTNAFRSQSLNSLAGKLLRIDRATGQGLVGNPFWTGNAGAIQSKIFAYGLRNPFKFTFRPGTTVPYVGDVGMNTWEELDVVSPGLNYGWPCYEGPSPHALYAGEPLCGQLQASSVQTPLLSLAHRANSCIIGGTFYTGSTYPEQYRGAYFYADCATRYIDYLLVDANNKIVSGPHRFGYLRYDASDFEGGGPTGIEMGPDGNLYVLETVYGNLSRIEVDEPKAPPQGTTYVSDLPWISVSNGYGVVERDKSNGNSGPFDGNTITLDTVTYSKGVGTHANSDIKVYLGKSCTNFTSDIGVDDEVGSNGSVVFEVRADGTLLTQSPLMTGASPTRNFSVDLTGKEELVLSVRNGGDSIDFDHSDWAGARVMCKGTPSVVSTAPSDEAVGVLPGTNITVTFNKAMNASTLTNSNISVIGSGSSTPLTFTLSYSSTTRTLFIDPANDLQSTSTFTVTVKGGPSGVKDTDGLGLYDDVVWSFRTSARPSAVISQPLSDLRVKVGDVVSYSGSATDAEDGAIPAARLSWKVNINHNCPGEACHRHEMHSGQGATGSFTVPDHGDNNYFEVVLTAVDSDGLTGSTSLAVHPKTVQVTLNSSPPGLQLVYDDFQATTPFTRTSMAGTSHVLRAPSPQGSYEFQTWVDGGAQTHNVQVGVTDTTYTAIFASPTPTSTATPSPSSSPTSSATPPASPTLFPSATATKSACNVKFSDVGEGTTYYLYVQCLACRGVLGGYGDGTFRPHEGITRGQLSKIVANAAGYNDEVSGQTFSDVPPGSTFYLFVERIAARGIVGGYADGTFQPGSAATRGQIAKVISNAAGYSDTPEGESFPDVPSSDTFYLYVERLAHRGIIGGYSDGTFRPANPASRGQVAKMVANTFFPACAPAVTAR